MLKCPDSGLLIVVGLQALALVSSLVLFYGPSPQTVPKNDEGAKSHRRTGTKGSAARRDGCRSALKITAVAASLASIVLGVANNDSAAKFLWPQATESQPIQLWDQAWEAMELWADAAEPLMPHAPDNTPHNSNNIYAAFYSLSKPHQIISELCNQLSFIYSGTSADTANADRETITLACDTADKNLDDFDSDWADLLSYFSRGWLKHPIRQLYSAGYNTSLFQYLKQQEEESEPPTTREARGFSPGNHPSKQSPFHNQTALHLLAVANPSFPELRPAAANMTGRLRSLRTRARTAAESIAAVSELVPQGLRGHRDEKPDDASSFAKQWTSFDFHSWWTGEEGAGGYGSAATRRAAKDLARLYEAVKAFDAPVAESVRRARAVEASLDVLARKVTALVARPKKDTGGLDGAWSELAWRADCGCDDREAGSNNIRAVATPVVVEYFVPSAEELFQGMGRTYGMLAKRKVEVMRRREGAFAEKERAAQRSRDEHSREHGEVAVGIEQGCVDMSVDEDGKRRCLRLDEVGSKVRSRFRAEFGAELGADPFVSMLDG